MGNATEDLQRAATLPENDVVRKLFEQHARIRQLFAEVRNGLGEERQQAFEELRGLLTVHETAEEVVVRPVVRRILGDEEPNERDKEEAQASKELQELSAMDVGDTDFLVKLGALEEAVDHHAEAEENNEFQAIENNCTPDQRESMGKQLEAALKVAPTRPHPSLAGHETTAMTIGPLAALVDRTRDAIQRALHD